MPNMANIVIKKADGTTDVTWTAIAAAGGDGIPAVWRNNSVGTTVAERPNLQASAKWNGPGTARRVNVAMSWPMSVTAPDGTVTITGNSPGSATFLAPQNMSAAEIKERAYQFGNLIASAIIKACFEEGYAPRSS